MTTLGNNSKSLALIIQVAIHVHLCHPQLIMLANSFSALRGRPFNSWGGGGGGGGVWAARFFSSNLVARILFSLLNALQDIFFPPHFSAGFFSSKKCHI